ncbi:MAG: glycosyltransferase family 4 protein [Syntrophobacterales bacterium]|nr:glycosyltransferase family 4 protein [Syntrophobacterales bacterium]
MKIAYLSRFSFPSSAANSVNVMKMCEAFASLGHDVLLFGHLKESNIPNIFDYYGIRQEFGMSHVVSLNDSPGDFLYILHSMLKTKKYRPHIAYGRSLEACFGVSTLGIPTILEIHSPPRTPLKRVLLRSISRMRNLKRIVAISEGLARYLRKLLGVSVSKKLCVAHDGGDPDSLALSSIPKGFEERLSRFKATLNNGSGRPRVGYIGNLYPGKGIELISKIASLCPWADFHIIGGSPQEIAFWERRLSRPNIYFHGYVPHALTGYLSSFFDVALMPTQPLVSNVAGNIDEGWYVSPLKLFEYMAAGVPILASNLESVKEVLEEGVTGFLLPHENPYAWRDALAFLRDYPDVGIQMGKRARETLIKHFSWKVRAEKVLKDL